MALIDILNDTNAHVPPCYISKWSSEQSIQYTLYSFFHSLGKILTTFTIYNGNFVKHKSHKRKSICSIQ